LQIMKLREDYKAMKGDKFSLQEFHDTFMRPGRYAGENYS